jgi:hypothetical protein
LGAKKETLDTSANVGKSTLGLCRVEREPYRGGHHYNRNCSSQEPLRLAELSD